MIFSIRIDSVGKPEQKFAPSRGSHSANRVSFPPESSRVSFPDNTVASASFINRSLVDHNNRLSVDLNNRSSVDLNNRSSVDINRSQADSTSSLAESSRRFNAKPSTASSSGRSMEVTRATPAEEARGTRKRVGRVTPWYAALDEESEQVLNINT